MGMLEELGISHYQDPTLVPRLFRDRVCTCITDDRGIVNPSKRPDVSNHVKRVTGRLNVCDACLKPKRYHLRRCTKCRDWFIKDFKLYYYDCPRHTMCWDCIQVNEPCECMTPPFGPHKTDRTPLGLNPKKYAPEELEDVFDF